MYYDNDADPSALAGQTVAIIGYGSQGHAHALNLHESGVDVDRRARSRARRAGRSPRRPASGSPTSPTRSRPPTSIMILVPDTGQKAVYDAEIAPNLRPGQLLMFAHGFNIQFGRIDPPGDVDVGMVAPKGPGHLLRSVYQAGGGVPALFAVERDASGTARARDPRLRPRRSATPGPASSRRRSRRRPRPTCSASSRSCAAARPPLVKMAFETLVEAGYQPELAYFETMHELKLIVDLMYRGGLNFMRFSVSDTAEYGDYVSGPRIIDERVRETMQARPHATSRTARSPSRWIAENESGGARVRAAPGRRTGTTRSSRSGAELREPDGVPQPGRRRGRRGPGRRPASAAPRRPPPRRGAGQV